ncbi:hypothetical protein DSECCO2_566510 [anaerobic digester metagenome]
MLKKLISIYLVLLLAAACSSKEETAEISPDSVFTEDSMKMLLIDFYLTEASIRQVERSGKDISPYVIHYYDLMLKKYQCDTLKISRSYEYWSAQPEKLKQITNHALDSLIVMETILQDQK